MSDKLVSVSFGDLTWEDLTVYEWKLRDTTPHWYDVIFVGVIPALAPVVISIGALILVALASSAVAFWLAWAGLAFFTLAVTTTFGSPKATRESVNVYQQRLACLGIQLGIWMFLIACPGHLFSQQFAGPTSSPFEWAKFFADNLLKVITLDVFDVFDVHLTSIRTSSFIGRLVTVIFRLLITFSVLEWIIVGVKLTYGGRAICGTVRDCFDECEAFVLDDQVTVTCSARHETIQPISGTAKEFLARFKAAKSASTGGNTA